MSKLMMLVAAKWREFSNINPHIQSENQESSSSAAPVEDSFSKPARASRASKEAASKIVEAEAEDFDDDDDDEEDERRYEFY